MSSKILLLLVGSLLSVSARNYRRAKPAKPHIIMIMADDLGWNDVGFNGGAITTPNIDALAAAGSVLKNYYTAPNCGPSRSQFLTGKYLTHLGLQKGNFAPCIPRGIPLTEKTVADELGALGYKNHVIGKWHVGFHTAEYLPTNRGFDTFRGLLNGLGDHFKHTRGFQGTQFLDFYNDTTPNRNASGVYSTDFYKQRALELIDEHDTTKQPMFMFLSFQVPHTPNQAPQRFKDLYAHIPNLQRRHYAAMVTAMDEAIGEIMADLVRRKMYDNTVVVFSTDNGGQALSGGASNYPFRGNKATYYEAGIKGVAVVASPLLKYPGNTGALFHITDWLPTFLYLAGGKSRGLDGMNQWNALSYSKKEGRRKEIIYNIDPLTVGEEPASAASNRYSTGLLAPLSTNPPFNTSQLAIIRFGDYKLITGPVGFDTIIPNPDTDLEGYLSITNDKNPNAKTRLFNIKCDPTESKDLSTAKPHIVRLLLWKLAKHEETAIPPFNPPRNPACEPVPFEDIRVWGPYL